MSKLQQRIAELSPEKRALLQKWILENRTAAADVQSISPRTSSGPCALSFAQQRLWFLAQLEPESPLYNVPKAIRIQGALNRAALQQALNAVVGRHQSLRSTFDFVAGSPVQVIGDVPLLELPVLDLRAVAAAEREAEIQRLSAEEARRPFNLSKDLMIRTVLLRVSEEEHVLLLTLHHIASDGWSMEILSREIASLYEDFSGGRPSRLPELSIQYADYALWQRQRLEGEVLASLLAYWKTQLRDLPPVLELPTDRPRPAIQSHRGARQSFRLSRNLSERIKALSRLERVTVYMTLLAAFQTLLHRYTGMEDIVVGSPIAGRDRMETEELIGFFVNTLVLRTDLSGDLSFRELIGRVREVALGAYAHQELPFEKLVEELQPDRNLSHNPLFQVVFVMQNAPRQKLELSGLSLTPREIECKTAKFDLTLSIRDTTTQEHELAGFLEYNTDLFDQATIARMIGHFENLIEAMIANPDERIGTCSLLTAAERHQLLGEWNCTAISFPKDKCVHELFEAQVERTPDPTALIFEDQRLTYRELNRRANQLAHHLKNLGVRPDVLVGLCLERSPEMLVALLGVLKAGGAYLPLDSSYPEHRLKVMLEDAHVSVLLTTQRSRTTLPSHKARVVCLDSDWPAINQESDRNPALRVDGEELAYVIYTSGSTGKPKGVQIPHRALSNHMQWMQAEFPLTADDRVVQRTRCGFDASVWEFYAPILAGAGLVIPRPAEQSDAAELIRVIQTQQVTILQIVPSLLRILLDEAGFENCRSLRRIFCGGEPLTVELRDRFRAVLPAELCNLYGPTEACIDATFYRCTASTEQDSIGSLGHRVDPVIDRVVPIGRAIANTQVYVLDPRQQPVPIGVPGELYIGGAGLARGYSNRPELTAETFLQNPFGQEPGSRLYRTGDLVRYGAHGTIEFLGRIDHQVKLRGFRIELGEIESVLSRHAAVRQAIVTLREDTPGDQRLAAYIVCHEGHSSQVKDKELKRFVGEKLPDYMIPSTFVFLEALPLTPSGKVDRKALPPAGQDSRDSGTDYVAPRDPVEQVVARIWGEVLKLERVSTVDNFFELGGHSLLATQVISRIRSTLRVDLPVRRLFEAPTVERLSQALITAQQPPGQVERIARIVMDITAMSDQDAKDALEKKRRQKQQKQTLAT